RAFAARKLDRQIARNEVFERHHKLHEDDAGNDSFTSSDRPRYFPPPHGSVRSRTLCVGAGAAAAACGAGLAATGAAAAGCAAGASPPAWPPAPGFAPGTWRPGGAATTAVVVAES